MIFSKILLLSLLFFNGINSGWEGRSTLKKLTEYSSHIIEGKVVDVYSKVEAYDKSQAIYTYVVIFPNSFIKGNMKDTILTIKMLGGKTKEWVAGSGELIPFLKDEEVILFLRLDQNSQWRIAGPSGKLLIVEKDGKKLADCSYLKKDEISFYSPGTYFEVLDIKNKIQNYLNN